MKYSYKRVISIVLFDPSNTPWPKRIGFDGTNYYCHSFNPDGAERIQPGDFIITYENDQVDVAPSGTVWERHS